MSVAANNQSDQAVSAMPVADQKTSSDFEDFIYLVSHDVRNSVRALIELPQWIIDDLQASGVKIDKSVAESIELMNVHTGRLDRMLVDLLAYSRVGRMQDVGQVQLDVALTEVLEEVRVPQGFRVVADIECNTIEMGERDALTLLTALVSNAVKHHDQKAGMISIAVRQSDEWVQIECTDDGPGIPEIYQDRVFSAMTTLRPRDEVEGSGMGLAIVQKIAKTYGGTAEVVRTNVPRGTNVRVTLPAHHVGAANH